jgi:hypothetical protein
VLHRVEGVNLVEGGWVGGDAWFVSVMIAVEVKKRLGVDSTWIIKGKSSYYPMATLYAVLKARFGTKVAEHWVVMTVTIGGVKLIDIACAWSQRGVSYFLSACGSTHQSTVLYQSNFEDEFGNIDFKFIPRPHIAHFLYLYLPLIDEHNTHIHSVLNLERKRPTKCC